MFIINHTSNHCTLSWERVNLTLNDYFSVFKLIITILITLRISIVHCFMFTQADKETPNTQNCYILE